MSSHNSRVSAPPVVFVSDNLRLAEIRQQITAPPDPQFLPWSPPPVYDAQAVGMRTRLQAAAKQKEQERLDQEQHQAQEHVRPNLGPVSFSAEANASFFERLEVNQGAGRSESIPTGSAFGAALGGRRAKKEAAAAPVKKVPRSVDNDVLSRLKTEFLKD